MAENILYDEKYRPQYHFSPPANWLNDPNGLVFYRGEYHLFYQYNPDDIVWGNIHWGHAVSSDLIHWKNLDIALEPDELGMIFSGSAVVDKNDSTGFFDGGSGLVAVYTSHLQRENGALEQQSIAYSTDNGRSWTKYEDNPVIDNYGVEDFRDPKVFRHHKSKKWIMITAAGDRVRFYSSDNLKEWDYLSEFGSEMGEHAGVWECPDLIKLSLNNKDLKKSEEQKDKWLLSIGDSHGRSTGVLTQYFIGEFDGKKFVSDYDKSFILDHGQDLYALQSWSNLPDDRKIWIGWMNNIGYMEEIPTDPWRGIMSLPRELGLKKIGGQFKLLQNPVREVKALRKNIYQAENLVIKDEMSIYSSEESYEIKAELDFSEGAEIRFLLNHNQEQKTVIAFSTDENKIIVSRRESGLEKFSLNFIEHQEFNCPIDTDNFKLNIFVDRSSLEIFIGEGEFVLSELFFPEKKPKKLTVKAVDGEIIFKEFEYYKLDSIWK